MLTQEENDLLCRVGAGTPMGELMRQYWLPIIYDWELEPDGQPQRVKLLGEDMLAWRNTSGVPAFTQNLCPHRGASLYFGRNEEEGLRCAYHGWKFDVDGNCVDMPNEPSTSNFKSKLKITSYKGADAGGVTWIYMGPNQENPPELPKFEWCLLPEEQVKHGHKFIYECNWMQALEGELDSTHAPFLHSRLRPELPRSFGGYNDVKIADFKVVNTEAGITYGAERHQEDGNSYWRTTHFLFPIYGMFPSSPAGCNLSIYVPIDDYYTLHMGVTWHPTKPFEGSRRPTFEGPKEFGAMGSPGPMKPEQKGTFFPNWWPEMSPETDFHMNLEAKKNANYTGIPNGRQQDAALEWSMGPIMDRTREHLGTADATIIRVRRRFIAAAQNFETDGIVPPGVENPQDYRIRSCQAVLAPDMDWLETLDAWHHASTTEYPDPIGAGVPVG
jgi:phthalate 4,5-dioxygenase oxygenase subunit